ncbi:Glyoxalase-like domain protein [Streptomyces sp. YIM 130001]|uniref:VOC family protein n=1 Tax=Streptomyces sp. YIM 130001 TaxID=2259644 RepID=UPI000EBE76AC|nr:VOC family protein [Streptomyces sp. YIM 130001]RII11259.1 Glyoxalase-like domain protein [Streptomyces sp. YIM 130001]
MITLFTEDLAATKAFYTDGLLYGGLLYGCLRLEGVYDNEDSAVFELGGLMVNVLRVANAPELVTPAAVGGPTAGPRSLMTIEVADANAVCAQLESRGMTLLNGPVDRPRGRRTAAFAYPVGPHVGDRRGPE